MDVATVKPSLFEIDAIPELKACFDRGVYDCFRDTEMSLEILERATHDPVLRSVRTSRSKRDPVMATHPSIKNIDQSELLLSLAVGYPDARLSRMFLVDRLTIATIRHDVETRYRTMFRWLDAYRLKARARGYATYEGKRKYIDGLRSSNLAKREQAVEYAVRWLIRF